MRGEDYDIVVDARGLVCPHAAAPSCRGALRHAQPGQVICLVAERCARADRRHGALPRAGHGLLGEALRLGAAPADSQAQRLKRSGGPAAAVRKRCAGTHRRVRRRRRARSACHGSGSSRRPARSAVRRCRGSLRTVSSVSSLAVFSRGATSRTLDDQFVRHDQLQCDVDRLVQPRQQRFERFALHEIARIAVEDEPPRAHPAVSGVLRACRARSRRTRDARRPSLLRLESQRGGLTAARKRSSSGNAGMLSSTLSMGPGVPLPQSPAPRVGRYAHDGRLPR